jgi:hypothetical protein
MTDEMEKSHRPNSAVHCVRVLIAGIVVGIPAGWLLAYLAVLPFFLGLFFFLLFGLLVGAIMYRSGKSAAPLPRNAVRAVGILTVLLVWGTGLFVEYAGLSEQIAKRVRTGLIESLDDDEYRRLITKTDAYLDTVFAEQYPPGGIAGYVRWITSDAKVEVPRVYGPGEHQYVPIQSGANWVIRVVTSLALLMFSILSQELGLADPPKTKASSQGAPEDASAAS